MPIKPELRALYPRDWKRISDRIRFERAGGQCECEGECGHDHAGRCAARHLEPHPITGSRVILTTAHRNHNPSECEDHHIFAACQRCHLAYDADHHAANRRATHANRRAAIMEKTMQLDFAMERRG